MQIDIPILKIRAREVLDSRGNPTVEAEVTTSAGVSRAIVPSGASTGVHEALELRDKGKRYGGKGVQKAVRNVNGILASKLEEDNCLEQKEIDEVMLELDGTENKSKIGANAMLAVSMAVCKSGARALHVPLFEYIASLSDSQGNIMPIPMMNVLNGGKHGGVENDFQEHMIMPVKFKTFSESLQAGTEVYHKLKSMLKRKYCSQAALLGDEGGFVPPIREAEKRLEMMNRAIEKAGYKGKVALALDCASSEFFYKTHYKIGKKKYNAGQLIDYYKKLVKKYNIISIEDGMAEDDWEGWQQLNKEMGKKVQIVGDDLLVTNAERIKKAKEMDACNALLLKVNQIGTVTESIEAANLSRKFGWKVVVSHRSGESEDSFIADLAVGLNAGQCKFGAPARTDRTAKYNQLLRIEETLGKKARYGRR